MKKSIFLFFAAILCATSAWSVDVFKDGQYIYYQMTGNSNWTQATYVPMFGWYWDSGNWCNKELGKEVPGTDKAYYYQIVPNAYIGYVQIMRMNGSNTSEEWNYSNKKGVPADKTQNCYYFKSASWSGGDLSIKTYAPPMSSVTLADNGTTVNSGTGAQADPYIIEIGTKIKVQASGTKAVDDPDAVINYAFKYGATSQDSETTTWEIDANSPSTTYAIELEGYTKVNTTSSEKKAATKLYYQTVADATLPTYQVTVTANNPAMGTVTGAGEYSEGATAELTATPNDGYKFVNWTVGSTEKSTNPTYSFMVIENVTLVANFQAIPEETVYFINTNEWTGTINAYAWTDGTPKVENAGWAGLAATKEDFQIGGYDVYSYTAKQGLYANVIFNGTGGQTTDLIWSEGVDKYYIHGYNGNTGWYTEAEAEAILVVPVEYDYVYLINTNDWAKAYIYTWESEVHSWPGAAMTKEATQIAGKDVYSYKVVKGTTFGGLNFNCGGDECKTGNLTWQAGKYYAPSKDTWYADAAAAEAGLAVNTYTVVGSSAPLFGEAWAAGKAENDMTLVEGTKYELVKTDVSLTVGEIQYKVAVNHAWTEAYPGDNAILNIAEAGKYTVTFTFDSNTKAVNATAELTEAAVVLPTVGVKGAWDSWAATTTLTGDNTSASATVNIATAGIYEFGLDVDGNFQASGATIDKANNSTVVTTNAGNMKLTANVLGEYTFTWTYETNTLTVTYPVGEEIDLTPKYYIAGTQNLTGFDWKENGLEILKDGDVYKHTFSEMNADTYEFKITDGTWINTWGFSNLAANYVGVTQGKDGEGNPNGNIKIVTEEAKNIIVIFDAANNKITLEGWDEEAPAEVKCYLMGIGGDWTTGIEMEEDGDQFKLLCQPIAEGEQFKFKYGDTWTTDVENYDANGVNWVESYPGSGQYNITLPAGNYDFYYKKNDNKVWIGVCTPATPTPDYTRAVTPGNLGTICLPFNVPAGKASGATFYTLAGKDANGRIAFDEVNGELAAGVSYLFQATATEIVCFYGTESVLTPDEDGAMKGTFVNMTLTELTDIYYFAKNALWSCVDLTELIVPANCAYVDMGKVEPIAGAAPVGVRRITLGVNGQNTATGMENIDASAQPVKTIINGQLFILRGEKMYDAQGKLVK